MRYSHGELVQLAEEGRRKKMDDLISRQTAIDAVRELYIQPPKINNDIVYDMAIDQAHDALVNLPTAQPERKKGQWRGKPIAGYCTVRCSVCKNVFSENNGRWNFCPDCGADMREGGDNVE